MANYGQMNTSDPDYQGVDISTSGAGSGNSGGNTNSGAGSTVYLNYSLRGQVRINLIDYPFAYPISQVSPNSEDTTVRFKVILGPFHYYNGESEIYFNRNNHTYEDSLTVAYGGNNDVILQEYLKTYIKLKRKNGNPLAVDQENLKITWDTVDGAPPLIKIDNLKPETYTGSIDFYGTNFSKTNISDVVIEFGVSGSVEIYNVYTFGISEAFDIEGYGAGSTDIIISKTYLIKGINASTINYQELFTCIPQIYSVSASSVELTEVKYIITVKEYIKGSSAGQIYSREQADKIIKIYRSSSLSVESTILPDSTKVTNKTTLYIKNENISSDDKQISLIFTVVDNSLDEEGLVIDGKTFTVGPFTIKGDSGTTEPKASTFTCDGYVIQNNGTINYKIINADKKITDVRVSMNPVTGAYITKSITGSGEALGTIKNTSTSPSVVNISITFSLVFSDSTETIVKSFTLLPKVEEGMKQLKIRLGAKVDAAQELGLIEEKATCELYILNYHE